MAMGDYEKSKFRFSETFNNSNGKTSGSGFIGVIMGLVSVLGFIVGLIGFFLGLQDMVTVLEASLQLGLLSSVLMGVRKASGMFSKSEQKIEIEKKDKDKDPPDVI